MKSTPETSIETNGRPSGAFSLLDAYREHDISIASREMILDRGVMRARREGDADKILPITPANEIFFWRNKSDVYELTYQGSGLIVSMLEGRKAVDADKPHELRRPLAFFDKDGNFYDQAILVDLNEEIRRNGREVIKHSAVVKFPAENDTETSIAIDNIHCIAPAASIQEN